MPAMQQPLRSLKGGNGPLARGWEIHPLHLGADLGADCDTREPGRLMGRMVDVRSAMAGRANGLVAKTNCCYRYCSSLVSDKGDSQLPTLVAT